MIFSLLFFLFCWAGWSIYSLDTFE